MTKAINDKWSEMIKKDDARFSKTSKNYYYRVLYDLRRLETGACLIPGCDLERDGKAYCRSHMNRRNEGQRKRYRSKRADNKTALESK